MQRIKKIIIPLLKGLPIIIGCFLIALYIGRKAIQYSVPMYQSIAKIKLDDRKYGLSANNLYEDFDVFSSENKIETEAEILKSPLLVGKTIDAMHLDALVSRVGRIKTTRLYKDVPFLFTYDSEARAFSDVNYLMKVSGEYFELQDELESHILSGKFGEPFVLEGDTLTILKNQKLLAEKNIETNGTFHWQIKSRNQWIKFISGQLDIKAIDKEIPVLRVVMKSEDPDFSADFVNKLCEVYVNDYIYTKSLAATKTLGFIDERMTELKTVLSQSENKLEDYKLENGVVNTLQETETGLRDISKLRLQLINLEMEEQAIIELEAYISAGDYYEQTAINFGFGDLLLTELVKKLKLYTDEKRDFLVKYTENDPKVINAQEKIDDIENYIKEAIRRNKSTIQTKKIEIEAEIEGMSHQFDEIPTREKEMRILERDFQINESVYTFLAQKKLEAQIASSALMSFHRVIQPAIPSREPVSPNKILITFVSGFLGLIAGILFVFGGKVVRGKVLTKVDIEKLTATPVVGVLTKTKSEKNRFNEFLTLATAVRSQAEVNNQTFVITSSTKKEGKSYTAMHLAEAYQEMGYKTALLDLNYFNPVFLNYDFTIDQLIQSEIEPTAQKGSVTKIGLCETEHKIPALILAHKNLDVALNRIKNQFDFVIIDTPGSVISIEALRLLRHADLCLYIIKTKTSRAQYVPNVDIIQEDYQFENMKIVLNGAHPSTNYSGNFNGSQLHYAKVPKGIFKKLVYYYQTYAQ